MNEHEARARTVKAYALVCVLRDQGVTAAMVADLSDESRRLACQVARIRPASRTTWDLVAAMMERSDEPSDASPFEGLGAR